MAMSDLSNELQKDTVFDDATERKIVAAIIKALDDKNGEVQNLAVKTLAPLVRKSRDQNIQEIVDRLCDMLIQKNDVLKDIAAIGLKTVILEIPTHSNATKSMIKKLVSKLIGFLSNVDAVQLDTIDILSDVIVRFGNTLNDTPTDGVKLSPVPPIRQIQDVLFPYLSNPRPAIRKRTIAVFGNLVVHTTDDLFDTLIRKSVTEMGEKEGAEDFDRLKTFVGCVGVLARFSSRRFGKYIDTFVPLLTRYILFEDDELREACFQTFESFILRCPTEVTGHIEAISALSLEYMKHDPNYSYDSDEEDDNDENDEDENMDEDGDGDDEDDEEGYSDDEDVSWKVRRASVKTLSSIISTRVELILSFFDEIAPALIKRFKEREESVRVEILSTFIALLKQVGATSSGTRLKNAGPILLLRNLVTRLSKNLAKELNGKSVQTRQFGFVLLKELASVLHGGLDDNFGLFVASIEASLATGTIGLSKSGPKPINNLNLKIEVLDFLKIALASHKPEIFAKYFAKLVSPIVASINGKFYKVTSDALLVSVELVKALRPIPTASASLGAMEITPLPPKTPKATDYILEIYTAVLNRVKVADLDIEVKERSISALGTLLAQASDFLPADQIKSIVWPLVTERLHNELTRLTTVRALKTICDSPLCIADSGVLDISTILDSTIIAELGSFLRKSNRQLRLATLSTLAALFTKFGKNLSPATVTSTLNEVQPVILEADMNIFPLAIDLVNVILSIEKSDVKQAALHVAKTSVANNVVLVSVSSPHVVAVGSAGLESLTEFWSVLARIGGVTVFAEMSELLTNSVSGVNGPASKLVCIAIIFVGYNFLKYFSLKSYRPVAQSIAALIVEVHAKTSIDKYVSTIQNASATENITYLSLNVIGAVGRRIDLSLNYPTLHDHLLALFSSPSEEIKHAAAFALGNVASGNLDHYMPIIIQNLREGGKRRYTVLVALKEVIARSSSAATTNSAVSISAVALTPFAKDLWTLLFESTEQAKEEGTRTVIAECLGKLSVSNSETYLSELVKGLHSSSSAVRATVVMAIRYTFTDVSTASSVSFDEALSRVILQFLRLLTDADLNVRHIALATLNSAAHNKPYLIADSLGELLPLLYAETFVKEELIHTVVMGPFKHKVDDGLDARKSAFECMYTLLERCLAKIEIFAFLDRVTAGLGDAAQEIKMMNHMILQRVAALSPAAVVSRLDGMVPALKEAILAVPKANAVKQEIEKVNELVRSGIRAIVVVAKALLASTSSVSDGGNGSAVGGGSSPVFDEFWREINAPGYALAEVVNSVSAEVDAQPAGKSQNNQMDLS
ncbi:Cullin-associated NEDD8-dissociated protein 2 [Physocladia obscura]|uniref:Cullin-associated NEDD8-dissociated protein 2 n=1 Tax=Physocladia obscura TaxID=109957 RepID=A0AAD5TAJ9_9FUNG|nr:Cullin-associated NEDD8-dissociated protein 2 [Physocladia obscura]